MVVTLMFFMNLLILLLRLRSLVLQNPQAAKEYERTYALQEEGFNKALQAEQEREAEGDNTKLRNLVSADGRTYIHLHFQSCLTYLCVHGKGSRGVFLKSQAVRTPCDQLSIR